MTPDLTTRRFAVASATAPDKEQRRMCEAFTKPQGNVIRSSEGFTVEVLGHVGMRYAEGDRYVSIDSEGLATGAIDIAPWSIRFWEGSNPDRVSDVDRDRIVANIKRAFASCGEALQAHEPLDWSTIAIRRPEDRHRRSL